MHVHTFEIEDPIFGDLYTIHARQNGSGWRGWLPDVPGVDCTARTKKELLRALKCELQTILENEEQEWKRRFGEVVKTGKLDELGKEALEDVQAGRFTYL